MIITGIALAVAAIPEGLPAVVTITLALGLQRLAKSNALIRKLPAVEALGSTTVICADKTGTLTKNEMMISKIWYPDKLLNVTGEGYETKGKFYFEEKEIDPKKDEGLALLLKVGALCNNARLEGESLIGDPTEGAFIVAAEKAGFRKDDLEKAYERTKEIPFSSERKMMTTVNRDPKGGRMACVKGAPEVVLDLCNRIFINGKIKKLERSEREKILEINQNLAKEALRVLGVAYRGVEESQKDIETDLIFLGLAGMIDPPREEVAEDILLCKKAGIKVVMVTGDHKNTAIAIAKKLNLFKNHSKVLTGEELDSLSNEELKREAKDVVIYARVNPLHKVRIIDALKKEGHIIAMTGDGVNDAPALKKADIGIAMGIKGTDVAKEASDMILRDDHFSSIVKAVKEGRGIYDNIKKFIQYLLSSNLGEVLIVFVAMLIGFTDPELGTIVIPVTALQLLWINLLTDGLPALALGVDPPSPGIMERPPRNPKERILSKTMLTDIVIVGVLMCMGTLFLFSLNLPFGANKAITIAFTTIVIFEMVRVQSVRMKYKIGIFSNKKLIIAITVSILLQLIVIYMPFLQPIFKTTSLNVFEWIEIISVGGSVLVIMWIKEKIFKRKWY
jgi:Ca2+-transporting ATPase